MRYRSSHFETNGLRGLSSHHGANIWSRNTKDVFDDVEGFLNHSLQDVEGHGDEEKWPLAYTAAFVLMSSLVLWGGIIFGLTRLF